MIPRLSLIALLAVTTGSAFANETLSQQIESLNTPESQLITSADREKIYAVQSRMLSLTKKHELTLGGSRMISAENYLISHQASATYRFHFTDRWNVSSSASYVFNQLSHSAKRLIEIEKIYPDVPFVRMYGDVLAGFNVFYGKIRPSMEQVIYFDQYVALGGGTALVRDKLEPAIVGDIGFAFWLGKMGSFRLGLKDSFHPEQYRRGRAWTHDLLGHLDIGILFGGGA